MSGELILSVVLVVSHIAAFVGGGLFGRRNKSKVEAGIGIVNNLRK